jgi:hypothetical protein
MRGNIGIGIRSYKRHRLPVLPSYRLYNT